MKKLPKKYAAFFFGLFTLIAENLVCKNVDIIGSDTLVKKSNVSNLGIADNASNFKLIIQNTDTENKKFQLDFSHSNSVYKKAGFDKKLYEGTNYITSDTSMILNSSEYILINVNRFGSNISTKNGTGSFFIPSQSIREDMIAYNESSNFQQTIDVVNLNLSDLHIQILDDEGTLLESDSEINLKLLLRCYKRIQM